MNRTTRTFTRLAALATIFLGLVLATAGQAAARTCVDPTSANMISCPSTSGGGYNAPTTTPVQNVADGSIGTVQWALFAVAVLAALAIGAALMDLVRRRRQLAH